MPDTPPAGTVRAELAEAAVARARRFSAELRGYCSPHGVSALYADRLDAALDSPAGEAQANRVVTDTRNNPSPAACPTGCDSDCDAACREAHAVPWKRQHPQGSCHLAAPACRWPHCLTPDQQRQLAGQVDAEDRGGPAAPMPDQQTICRCAEQQTQGEAP